MQAPKDFGLTLAYAAPEDVRRLGRGECCDSLTKTPRRRRARATCELYKDIYDEDANACGYVCIREMRECERCRVGCPEATLKFTFYLGPKWFQFVFIFVHLSVSQLCIFFPHAQDSGCSIKGKPHSRKIHHLVKPHLEWALVWTWAPLWQSMLPWANVCGFGNSSRASCVLGRARLNGVCVMSGHELGLRARATKH